MIRMSEVLFACTTWTVVETLQRFRRINHQHAHYSTDYFYLQLGRTLQEKIQLMWLIFCFHARMRWIIRLYAHTSTVHFCHNSGERCKRKCSECGWSFAQCLCLQLKFTGYLPLILHPWENTVNAVDHSMMIERCLCMQSRFSLRINVLNLRNKTLGAGCPKSNVTRQVNWDHKM